MSREEPLHYRSLARTAADIAAGAISAEETTRHTLARIATLEPTLHAFAMVRGEAALAEARAADARRSRGEALGPLHGVPIAIKDLCAMAGTPTRAGGRFPTRFAESDTATLVERLQAAGAIVVGKAELTEGAWGAHHPDVTAPVNPWAADRWTGVSSSGSGVSVAAGMAYGAIGSDTAGSIRFPSSCNHLVGLKPTWGRVSRHGVFPLSDTFDHLGPMTRTALDAALMFDAIEGADPLDPTSLEATASNAAAAARAGTLKGVKIGLDPAYALAGLDPPTETAFRAAIALMAKEGAEIVEVSLPDVRPFLERAIAAALSEAAISHAPSFPSQRSIYGPAFAAVLDAGRANPVLDYAAIAIWRREFRGALVRLFARVDMLVAPAMPIAAPPLAAMAAIVTAPPESAAPLLSFTIPFNLAGNPTLTLPMGPNASGVPIGFQLIGPDLAEAALLAAGAGYEQASGFSSIHPPV
ncbi:MAG TPA: amidase [Caulobacteraceae bacterium]|nr:amidase [Caulobacteraceae bacterium]